MTVGDLTGWEWNLWATAMGMAMGNIWVHHVARRLVLKGLHCPDVSCFLVF